MTVEPTSIPDVLILTPEIYQDDRGWFSETYNKLVLKECDIDLDFVQDNQSNSKQYVLRGLHFQAEHPQGKLIRVTQGTIFDVVVDIRPNSPTFKQWTGIVLSEHNLQQLWIPPGLAHGFLAIYGGISQVQYKVTDYRYPEFERTLNWNDPDLNIDWPLDGKKPIVSEKDSHGLSLQTIIQGAQ